MLGIRTQNTESGAHERHPRRPVRIVTGLVVIGALALGAATVVKSASTAPPAASARTAGNAPDADREAQVAKAAAARKTVRNLMLQYRTKKRCEVFLNYPPAAVAGNAKPAWTVDPGKLIVWRYNADPTWSVVTTPARKKQGLFPWWGFTRRSCIGKSIKQTDVWEEKADGERVTLTWYPQGRRVPRIILNGRTGKKGRDWVGVGFHQPASRIVRRGVRTCGNSILRDRQDFAIGNVKAGWRVHVTAEHRTGTHWVKVEVPNAQRWGYIETADITCPAATAAAKPAAPPEPASPAPPSTSAPAAPAPPPASAPAPATPPPGDGSTCHWKVIWPAAGVYDDPTRSRPPLKSKHSGDIVGPFCDTQYNAAENETYVRVQTDSAPDGIGWMRLPALQRV